ncbi:MAG: TlpA disulfide reductase family protein [Microthrixaceae bacterium]
MAKQPKIQYGGPNGGRTPDSAGDGPSMALKVGIAALVLIALITVAVFAVKDQGENKGVNYTAYSSVTVTGTPLAAFPADAATAIPSSDPAIGQTIPTLTGKNFDGDALTIRPGEPMLIAVIAHWCPHCQKEVPLVVEWQASGTIPKSVKVVGISTAADESRGNFPPASWLAKDDWKNDTLVDSADTKGLNAMGVAGFPTIVAVTKDGKVALRGSGEMTEAEVKRLAEAALGHKTTATEGDDSAPITSPAATSTTTP